VRAARALKKSLLSLLVRESVIALTYYSEKKAIFHKLPETSLVGVSLKKNRATLGERGAQSSGFAMLWAGIFAIAEFFRVKNW
jgi:hypothetical protein